MMKIHFATYAILLLSYSFAQAHQFIPPPKSDSLCMNNGHVLGKWINGSEPADTKKTYYSCGWGDHDYKSNPQLCGWGARIGEQLVYGHKTWLMQTGGFSSECDKRDDTRWKFTQRERYRWEPMLCDLIPWNATQFCELLGNRTILMLGDSTMHQTAASIMSRVTSDSPPMESCADQLSMGRFNKFGPEKGQVPAINHIREVSPDIVILNTGAHFMTTPEFFEDLVHLEALQKEVHDTFHKKVTFVWKTMNPGHINCSSTSNGPLVDHWSHRHDRSDLYNWFIFPKQDSYAKREIARMGMKLIDMSPLYYRQDAHSDCLHYCLPGPVDLFSVLLLNMLYNEEL